MLSNLHVSIPGLGLLALALYQVTTGDYMAASVSLFAGLSAMGIHVPTLGNSTPATPKQ